MSEKKPLRNGKSVSKRSVPRSTTSSRGISPELTALLKTAYNAYQKRDDPEDNARCRWNFTFHMTDWIEDLRKLANLYEHPEHYDKETAKQIVFSFLIHAVPHLKAAARNLGMPARDIFHEPDQQTSGRY
jgi:hypothetical protein